MYRVEVVHRDIALECHETVVERWADSARISWADPHEFRVTSADDGKTRRIDCEPYPYFTPPELVTLVTLGHFELERDSVTLSKGQLVKPRLTNEDPQIIRCYDLQEPWRGYPSCGSFPEADSALLVTQEIRERFIRIMPCFAKVPSSTGPGISVGISDCVQVTLITTDFGPGIERDPEVPGWGLRATGCGGTWVSLTKRDSGGTQWPEPFPSYARLEVEITC